MTTQGPDTIPFVDLVGQYRRHQDELDRAIKEVLSTSAFIGGPALGRFEKAFAEFTGVKHCVGVGNGTDAIYLALRGMGIGAGDEVLCPVNTFIATSEAISMTGAKVVFVDVDPRHALIDPAKAGAAVTKNTRAIVPVHLYGQLADMDAILALATKHDLSVLEDTAQAHGATWQGKRAGSFGRAATFSFYPGKNLGAYGDAGAMVTSDDALAEKVRKIANHGRADKFGHEMEGVNSRLDGLQAAILEVKLRHLETWTSERRSAAKRYSEMLSGVANVVTPSVRHEGGHVFHLYVIQVKDRDGLRKKLTEKNIQSGIHYPTPLHLLKAYEHLGHQKGSFPVAERIADEIVSLPLFPEITEAQQARVVEVVREHARTAR